MITNVKTINDNLKTRSWNGYFQSKYEGSNWKFQVLDFYSPDVDDSFCVLRMHDGSQDVVRIDPQNRIYVRNKIFTDTDWVH